MVKKIYPKNYLNAKSNPPTLKRPKLKLAFNQCADTYVKNSSIENKKNRWRENPETNLWKKLHWPDICLEAEKTLENPSYELDQNHLWNCGPISVLHALATNHPEKYLQLVRDVYSKKEYVTRKLANSCNYKKEKIFMENSANWMVLAAVINKYNKIFSYQGNEKISNQLAAATTSPQLQLLMKKILKHETVKSYFCPFGNATKHIQKINTILDKKNGVVIASVKAGYIEKYTNLSTNVDPSSKLPWPLPILLQKGHYVRILAPIEITGKNAHIKFFTWGQDYDITMPIKDLKKMTMEWIVSH